MTNIEALLKTVDAATEGVDFVYDRLQSGNFDRKVGLVTVFCTVAIGMIRGLICLARYNLNTAAFALERPITETVMRGAWIYFCAEEPDINRVVADDPRAYPRWIEMQKAVNEALQHTNNETAMRYTWDRLNSQTHTGVFSLFMHRGKAGMMEPQYSVQDIIRLVQSATGLVVFLMLLQIASCGREDLAVEARDHFASITDLHSL